MKKFPWLKICLILMSLANAGSAWAVPSASTTQCGPIDIVNETQSDILRDSEDCKILWVMPPKIGRTRFKGLVPSSNSNYCEHMKFVQTTSLDVFKKMKQLEIEKNSKESAISEAKNEVKKSEQELSSISKRPGGEVINELRFEILNTQEQISVYLGKLGTCLENCKEINEQLRELNSQLGLKQREILKLEMENHEIISSLKIAEDNLRMAKERLEREEESEEKILERLNRLRFMMEESYQVYGKLDGGTALIQYDTGWESNLEILEKKYPQYEFRKIETRNTRIFANFGGAGDEATYFKTLPSLLDYSIQGTRFLPFGEQKSIDSPSLPSMIAGNMRLTLIGSCPLQYKNFLSAGSENLEEREDYGTGPEFSVAMTFEYPMSFKFKVSASYNLYKFYEVIKQEGRQKKFFSSKSWSSVMEKEMGGDAFKFNLTSDNPDLSEKEISNIRQSIKVDLFHRVLNTMAEPLFNGSIQSLPVIPTLSSPGLSFLGVKDGPSCGFLHGTWCTGIIWVLRGAADLFNEGVAEARFKKEQDRTAVEYWAMDTASWRAGVTTFLK